MRITNFTFQHLYVEYLAHGHPGYGLQYSTASSGSHGALICGHNLCCYSPLRKDDAEHSLEHAVGHFIRNTVNLLKVKWLFTFQGKLHFAREFSLELSECIDISLATNTQSCTGKNSFF